MNWSPQQSAALSVVARWLERGGEQIFRLFGYAGTGKTTLAREFAEGVNGRVLFAAYTGKAALCLRRAGCSDATTLHSLIYRPRDKSRKTLFDLDEELRLHLEAGEETDPAAINLIRAIEAEKKNLRRPSFELKVDSELDGAALLVVDEVSMVDEAMALDILSFGVPVLAIGDPFQLPPVYGEGYFTNHTPDAMLTEIHRQARDNPIIVIASEIRESNTVPPLGDYGESRIVGREGFDPEDIPYETQVVVGRRRTRAAGNLRRRRALGFQGPPGMEWLPVIDDRLICLRNDHTVGLLNGAIWHVDDRAFSGAGLIDLNIRDEDTGEQLNVIAHPQPFRGEEVPFGIRRQAQEFDYGYVLTCHKAQGSQWDDVLVVDESRCFRNNSARWLYTAVTRAAERLTLVRW